MRRSLHVGQVGKGPVSCYREFAPPAILAPYLVCLWAQTIGDGAHPYAHRVLPDGCVDIVWIGDESPIVAGPATAPVVVSLPPLTTALGVRFRPGVASAALGVPASELLDRDVPLRDVSGGLATVVSDSLFVDRSARARLAVIEAALASSWTGKMSADPLVDSAVAWLARHPAGSVQRLAEGFGISTRHLQRRFVAAVGYPPKTFQRIVRFQRLLASARRDMDGQLRLGELALAVGYADQPHMTREVRQLSGTTPTVMLGSVDSTLAMSDLFKTHARAPT